MTHHDHRGALLSRARAWLQFCWPLWAACAVHAPALLGILPYAPSLTVAGLATGGHQWLAGWPWIDGNVGVTTEALGILAARSWLHGTIPWWNHFSGIGLPLAAEGQTTAMFLPFGLLLALPHGMLWLRLTLLSLAGFFTRALLHRLGLRGPPAVAGALLFEFNLTFAYYFHGPTMPVAFLPLVLLGLEQARARPGLPPAAILGTAWTFLAGFPETAALNLLFAGVWAALRAGQSPAPWIYARRAAGAALAGIAIAAPAIVPFVQALPDEWVGAHAGPITGWNLASWGMMLFPFSQGGLVANILDGSDPQHLMFRVGGGLALPLIALMLAGLRPGAPEKMVRGMLWGWLLLTAARVIDVPQAVWLTDQLPLLRQAAILLYVMPSWAMAGAILAAVALADWQSGARLAWRWPVALSLLLAAATLAAAAPLIAHAPRALAIAAIAAPLAVTALLARLTARAATPARLAAATAVLTLYAGAVVALPALATPRGAKLDTAAIRFLQTHLGNNRVASTGPLWANYGAEFGIAELNHNTLPIPATWVQATIERFGITDKINFWPVGNDLSPAHLAAIRPQLQALGVRYVLAWWFQKLPPDFAGPPVYTDALTRIYELPSPAPYASAPGCTLAGTRDTLRATCASPTTLTRRELAWPGWRATVNGTPPTVAAQGIFQTVALPAGESTIRFTYRPPRFALILGLTILGLATLTLSIVHAARRSSRSQSNEKSLIGASGGQGPCPPEARRHTIAD